MQNETEKEILALISARNEEGLRLLEATYGRAMKSIIANHLPNRLQDAEECFNDVMMALWGKLSDFQPDSVKAYVYRVTRNQALLKYRSVRRYETKVLKELPVDELEETIPNMSEDLTPKIEEWLSRQKKVNRVIFVRRFWFCDSAKMIAERVALPISTVYKRLSRMKENLKKFLEEARDE